MGLFKPAWMASSYPRHEKAVAAVKKITDPERLFEIAMTAPLTVVRQAAVEGIPDERMLARILRENDSAEVTEKALERVSDPALLKDAALNCGPGTTFKVLEKIDDSQVLVEIAMGAADGSMRDRALKVLHDRKDIGALLALIKRCPSKRERGFAFSSIDSIISYRHTWDKEYRLPQAQREALVDAIVADREGCYQPDGHLAINLHTGMTVNDLRRLAKSAANPAVREYAWEHLPTSADQLLPLYREAVKNGWGKLQRSVMSRLRKLDSGDTQVLMEFIRSAGNLTIREICAVRLAQDDMDGVEGIEGMRDEAVEAYIAAFDNIEDKHSEAAYMCQFANGLTPAVREKYGFTVSAQEVSEEDGYGRYTRGQTTVTYRGKTYRN